MISLIATGGTIDKDYDAQLGELFISNPSIAEIFAESNLDFDLQDSMNFQSLFSKDSLEFTDEDRDFLSKTILNCEDDYIIVTHGTDTMSRSAQAVEQLLTLKNAKKIVIFTGAMRPFRLNSLEAIFNIGFATGVLQTLIKEQSFGVFICMNAKIFSATEVYKDKSLGIFREQ